MKLFRMLSLILVVLMTGIVFGQTPVKKVIGGCRSGSATYSELTPSLQQYANDFATEYSPANYKAIVGAQSDNNIAAGGSTQVARQRAAAAALRTAGYDVENGQHETVPNSGDEYRGAWVQFIPKEKPTVQVIFKTDIPGTKVNVYDYKNSQKIPGTKQVINANQAAKLKHQQFYQVEFIFERYQPFVKQFQANNDTTIVAEATGLKPEFKPVRIEVGPKTVKNQVSSYVLIQSKENFVQLSAKLTTADNKSYFIETDSVSILSENPDIANVSNGQLIPIKNGETIIKYRYDSGESQVLNGQLLVKVKLPAENKTVLMINSLLFLEEARHGNYSGAFDVSIRNNQAVFSMGTNEGEKISAYIMPYRWQIIDELNVAPLFGVMMQDKNINNKLISEVEPHFIYGINIKTAIGPFDGNVDYIAGSSKIKHNGPYFYDTDWLHRINIDGTYQLTDLWYVSSHIKYDWTIHNNNYVRQQLDVYQAMAGGLYQPFKNMQIADLVRNFQVELSGGRQTNNSVSEWALFLRLYLRH